MASPSMRSARSASACFGLLATFAKPPFPQQARSAVLNIVASKVCTMKRHPNPKIHVGRGRESN
eukprot:4941633-Pyramimonas_sp.AAC.1